MILSIEKLLYIVSIRINIYTLIYLFIQEISKKEEFFTFDVYSIFLFFFK